MTIIEFDIYLKIIGGIGLLSALSQITSFFKLIDEIKGLHTKIEDKRGIDGYSGFKKKFHKQIEKDLKKADNLYVYFRHFMIILVTSILSVVCYAICKNIPCIVNEIWYFNTIAIFSYLFVLIIPSYFLLIIYNFFNLYYRLINYNSLYSIYSFKP